MKLEDRRRTKATYVQLDTLGIMDAFSLGSGYPARGVFVVIGNLDHMGLMEVCEFCDDRRSLSNLEAARQVVLLNATLVIENEREEVHSAAL